MIDSDELIEYLPIKNELGCIRDLYIAQTKLVDLSTQQRHQFWGLFCHRNIKKGQFIGMYRGDWHNSRSFDCDAEDVYCLELSYDLLVTPGPNPDPQEYPIAMANEPNGGERANAMLVEVVLRDACLTFPRTSKTNAFSARGSSHAATSSPTRRLSGTTVPYTTRTERNTPRESHVRLKASRRTQSLSSVCCRTTRSHLLSILGRPHPLQTAQSTVLFHRTAI